jgi:Tfp pilus assembly protein PilE
MRNSALTLVELVVTISAIALIAAITAPQYLVLHRNTNMELVHQHVRVIGETMTQNIGMTGTFVPQNSWVTVPVEGMTPEEETIVASLAKIQQKGYTTDDYQPDAFLANYTFRTCPAIVPGTPVNLVGDKCFVLDPFGVAEEPLP